MRYTTPNTKYPILILIKIKSITQYWFRYVSAIDSPRSLHTAPRKPVFYGNVRQSDLC